jgi:hypothetical protein
MPAEGRTPFSEVLALFGQVWYLTGRQISGIADFDFDRP